LLDITVAGTTLVPKRILRDSVSAKPVPKTLHGVPPERLPREGTIRDTVSMLCEVKVPESSLAASAKSTPLLERATVTFPGFIGGAEHCTENGDR
jgi:hypothetical protein